MVRNRSSLYTIVQTTIVYRLSLIAPVRILIANYGFSARVQVDVRDHGLLRALKNVVAPVTRILTTINIFESYAMSAFLVLRRSVQLSKIIILIFR
jgi:hypothetical protein